MFSRFRLALCFALLVALALVIPVFAGGWAVITLDELPTGVVAGESFTVGFTVLQHGRTPLPGLDPTITATLLKEQFVVHAEAEGEPGHYTAMLSFPKEGEWRWSIQAFTMDQPMPTLSVAAPIAGSISEPVAQTDPVQNVSVSPLWIAGGLALAIGLISLLMAIQRKSRLAMALTGLCLVVGVASFVAVPAIPEVEAQSKSSAETSSTSSISQVELGRQLFVAKGCITCHVNQRVGNSDEYWTIEMGAPNLSVYANDPDVLRTRLKDPSAVKADTKMPNLGLNKEEIEALVAFLNSR